MFYKEKEAYSSSNIPPLSLEITKTAVYVRNNIEEFSEEYEGEAREGYRYLESKYSVDEFITKLSEKNDQLEGELNFTSSAVYELMTIVLTT